MIPTSEQVAPHTARFLEMLDATFRFYGEPGGLPPRFRDAVAATPRHLFVHRFRLRGDPRNPPTEGSVLHDTGADPAGALDAIYSDAVMTHVDAAGRALPSSNSQPSYVLYLLHLLDLRPGQHVLEIGSGSGWLAAVMRRLVGTAGRVTGVEVIPELAAQSRADLERLGVGNVAVVTGDGERGHAPGAPYDRAMVTAAVWDLPGALFTQVAEGGRVLAPLELRGGGCQVTVLRRAGERFVGERAVAGWFVPLLGPGQRRPPARVALDRLPSWKEVGSLAPRRRELPLATGRDAATGDAVAAFRAFLGRTVPGFAVFGDADEPGRGTGLGAEPFGVVVEAGGSVAVWREGEVLGHGGPEALERVMQAYRDWQSCGMPGLAGLAVEVVRAGDAPGRAERVWPEQRGGTALVWRPRAERPAGNG